MNLAQYIGIKYDLHNRKGLNCWALVAKVYSDLFGDEIPEFVSKTDNPKDIAATFTAAFASGDHGFHQIANPVELCVAVFKRPTKFGFDFHCGIYHQGKILHSSKPVGMVSYQSIAEASRGFRIVEFWQK